MAIRVRGMPAVLLLVAGLAFVAWKSVTARTDLEAGAAQELSHWLRAEYAREQLRSVTGVEDLTPAKVDSLLAGQNVTFASLTARGEPDDLIVRAEILVNGSRPDDGEGVRYYRMSYSPITGWHMKRRTHPLLYYLKFY